MKPPGMIAGISVAACINTRLSFEAAKCAMPHGCGWYVIAVQGGAARELTEEENKVVNEFRFGTN